MPGMEAFPVIGPKLRLKTRAFETLRAGNAKRRCNQRNVARMV
jgi:hypothetical protein